jgi:hypothetical protein
MRRTDTPKPALLVKRQPGDKKHDNTYYAHPQSDTTERTQVPSLQS